mmetsp:Transcript_9980/g.14220  ORF Transcript_9980/g.14220 Transcript_9980/m.14220 type:complete len:157 (+) Transcript_9980:72-542(+)
MCCRQCSMLMHALKLSCCQASPKIQIFAQALRSIRPCPLSLASPSFHLFALSLYLYLIVSLSPRVFLESLEVEVAHQSGTRNPNHQVSPKAYKTRHSVHRSFSLLSGRFIIHAWRMHCLLLFFITKLILSKNPRLCEIHEGNSEAYPPSLLLATTP